MHQEKPPTLLRRCTQLAHWNSNNYGCQKHQEQSQPTNCDTAPTTRNISTQYLQSKHHQICHSGEQTTYQPGNRSSRKDTSGCHNTLQYHQFTLHLPGLPTYCTSHLLHPGKPGGLAILYETSGHACDAATTGVLSHCVLPVEDLQKRLTHIGEVFPSTMHLPVSSEDALHFYRYLCTHILITDEQFLLLIDVPIQDCAQQLEMYHIFNLIIPHRNLSAHYDKDNKYLGISWDETKAVEILEQQFITCQQEIRQFCSINAPLQPLANPPSCIAAIYTKNKAGIEKRCSLQIRNTQCHHASTDSS